MTKISPHLWYTDKADEAAAFYASIFPDARVDSVTAIEADNPSGPAGSVKVVEFTLCGQSFLAIGAGDRTAVGHVLEKFRIPTEKDPRRPVIDESTIKALLTVAHEIHPYLRVMIILAWRTGRRLSSILNLRWEDVDLESGTIRWRAEHDKIRQTWVVPMHREVHAELIQFRRKHPGIGPSLLFPHPQRRRQHSGPVTRHLAAWWLKEAFRRGELEKPSGSLWHMFRRVWATERKDLPLKDVAAVGGWRDTSTLLRYQQPDEITMRKVAEFERSTEPSPTPDQAVSNSHSYSHTPRK